MRDIDYAYEYEQLQQFLKFQTSKVLKNITVVDSREAKLPFMLHIDKKSPKVFIPMMPRRAAPSEDNTIARVTVAPTVLGCVIGYCDFLDDHVFVKESFGYDINALYYDFCLSPNEKLVFDSKNSDEHWLINYSKESSKYVPITVGKLFVGQVVTRPDSRNRRHFVESTFYVSNTSDSDILFTNSIVLKPGYYEITGDFTNYQSRQDAMNADSDGLFEIKNISKGEFGSKKTLHADMLDINNGKKPLPNIILNNWN